MASNRTHIPVGRAGAAVACAALGVPILLWVVPIVAAHKTSPWPDHLERIPRALWRVNRKRQPRRRWSRRWHDRLDRLLRRLQVHRRWTHWLSVGFAFAVAVGLAVAAVLFTASTIVVVALECIRPEQPVTMPPEVLQLGAWVALLAALGAFVGYALHTYLDGWTELGSPIGGPWRKERVHVVPKWIIRRRARRGREPWLNQRDEERLRAWAPRIVVACVAVHFHADLVPIFVRLFDAAAA